MEPFSFTRRLGTGSRVMRSLVAVARTTEQGRRGEGLSSFDSPRNCGRLVSGLAMKACMMGGGGGGNGICEDRDGVGRMGDCARL